MSSLFTISVDVFDDEKRAVHKSQRYCILMEDAESFSLAKIKATIQKLISEESKVFHSFVRMTVTENLDNDISGFKIVNGLKIKKLQHVDLTLLSGGKDTTVVPSGKK